MNIKTITSALIAGLAGGTFLFASPASGFDGSTTCDQATAESTECLPVPEPATFVSFCDNILLINQSNVTLTFRLGIDGADGFAVIPAMQQLEVAANYGDDGQTEIAAYDGETLVFSGIAKPYEHCDAIVEQTIKAEVSLDCDGLPTSGYIEFGIPEPIDSILSVETSNAAGTKGGLLYEGVVIPAGTPRYELSQEEIAAFRSQLALGSSVNTFTGYLTTEKGGGFTTFPISLVEAPEDTCVAVGEPPVPPTTPTTEPAIKVLETAGSCRTYTVTNIGTVVTGDTQFGVMLNQGNLPPAPIILQPGESIVYDLQVGETVSLGFSEEGAWTVNGPSEFTALSCVVDVDLGDDIIERPVVPTDPAAVTLPETGFPNVKVSQLAVLIVMIGGLLVLVARRPATV